MGSKEIWQRKKKEDKWFELIILGIFLVYLILFIKVLIYGDGGLGIWTATYKPVKDTLWIILYEGIIPIFSLLISVVYIGFFSQFMF